MSISGSTPHFGMRSPSPGSSIRRSLSPDTKAAYAVQEAEDIMEVKVKSGLAQEKARRARGRSLSPDTKAAYAAQEAEDIMEVKVNSGLAQEKEKKARGRRDRSPSPRTKAAIKLAQQEELAEYHRESQAVSQPARGSDDTSPLASSSSFLAPHLSSPTPFQPLSPLNLRRERGLTELDSSFVSPINQSGPSSISTLPESRAARLYRNKTRLNYDHRLSHTIRDNTQQERPSVVGPPPQRYPAPPNTSTQQQYVQGRQSSYPPYGASTESMPASSRSGPFINFNPQMAYDNTTIPITSVVPTQPSMQRPSVVGPPPQRRPLHSNSIPPLRPGPSSASTSTIPPQMSRITFPPSMQQQGQPSLAQNLLQSRGGDLE
jgi:hypothetical protein